MIIYAFPSGKIIVDTKEYSWLDNNDSWKKYVKENDASKKIEKPVKKKKEAVNYTWDDIPF